MRQDKTKPLPIPEPGYKWVISRSLSHNFNYSLGLWPESTPVNLRTGQADYDWAERERKEGRNPRFVAHDEEPFNSPKEIRRASKWILKRIYARAQIEIAKQKLVGEIDGE